MKFFRMIFVTGVVLTVAALSVSAQEAGPQHIFPKDKSKPITATIVWPAKNQEIAPSKTSKAVKDSDSGLDKTTDCPGFWTKATCVVNDPPNQNMLAVLNATSAQDAVRRANSCGWQVSSCSYYTPPVIACSPTNVCSAAAAKKK